MHLELPEHLLPTRDVLTRSLPVHQTDKAPAMPADLAAELSARFTPKALPPREVPRISPFAKLRDFLANPAFGVAAAAIALLAIAVPSLPLDSRPPGESFRGADHAAIQAGQVRIILVGADAAVRSAVEASGNFEISALASAPSAEAAKKEKGPKVIADFTTGSLTAWRADGSEAFREVLPTGTKDPSTEIARAVSGL